MYGKQLHGWSRTHTCMRKLLSSAPTAAAHIFPSSLHAWHAWHACVQMYKLGLNMWGAHIGSWVNLMSFGLIFAVAFLYLTGPAT